MASVHPPSTAWFIRAARMGISEWVLNPVKRTLPDFLSLSAAAAHSFILGHSIPSSPNLTFL